MNMEDHMKLFVAGFITGLESEENRRLKEFVSNIAETHWPASGPAKALLEELKASRKERLGELNAIMKGMEK